jgi:hypothetical protein
MEEKFEIAAQVIETGGGYLGAVLGLGENEGSLDDCLDVKCQAARAPVAGDTALANGLRDVRLESCGMSADALLTCLADGRVCSIDLLHHGSDEAGKVGQVTLKDGLAEIDVGEQAVEWVDELAVGCGGEEAPGDGAPMLGGRERQFFFTAEVMEEAAFGEASSLAEIFDTGSGIAFGADDVEGGVQDLGLRFVLCWS